MPHVSSSGGDDLENADQIKVYELEGDGEEKERVCAAKDLTEDKIDLTEPEVLLLHADDLKRSDSIFEIIRPPRRPGRELDFRGHLI